MTRSFSVSSQRSAADWTISSWERGTNFEFKWMTLAMAPTTPSNKLVLRIKVINANRVLGRILNKGKEG
jgi:hypothetical protein